MNTPDISWWGIFFMILLLVIPLALDYWLRLKLAKDVIISVVRMLVQLTLMGIFLEYLIKWDSLALNITWFFVMVFAASHSAIKRNKLSFRKFWRPIFLSMVLAVAFAVLYFNALIINVKDVFTARFFVVISGMILGNSMKGIIIVLDKFYTNIVKEKHQYFYRLSLGATKFEALRPWIRQSIRASLQPIIATTATMGLVSIPGMMTGQMLGGSAPMLAIKYQMAIVLVIFVAMVISVVLALFFSIRVVIDGTGRYYP